MTASNTGWLSQLEKLYRTYGNRQYGENCTQYEHMAQSGWWADEKGYGENLAIAAFLHDMGHLLAEELELPDRDELGYALHDELASDWLAEKGFPECITMPIAMHVQAKRYLVTTRAGYAEGLSEASYATLAQQGGPFSEQECKEFEASPFFEQAIRLRELDELGKSDDFNLPSLEYWLKRLSALPY